jgi:tetratricopeptide (TPR) repeat protein
MKTFLRAALLLAVLVTPVAAQGDLAQDNDAASRGESYFQYCLSRQAWFDRDYDAALDHMKRAAEANPQSMQLTLDLAELHLDLRQPREAVTVAKRAVGQAPELPAARDVLARALLTVVEGNDATEGEQDEALAAVMELLRLDPNNGNAYLALARLQINRGRVDQAMEALEQHLEKDPGSEEGVFMAAQVLTKLGRYADAEPFLKRAIADQPDDPRLRMALVEVYEAAGDLPGAYQEASALLQLRADQVRVRLTLARLSEMMGKSDDAVEHFREIGKLMDEQEGRYPAAERAEVELRMILLMLQADRFREAAAAADLGLRRFPADDRFRLRKGEALLMEGEGKEAREVMGEKQAVDAGDAEQKARIAEAYLSAGAREEREGDHAAAEKHLTRAVELDPHNDVALNYLGFMLADQGVRLDEAIGYIRRALDKEPGNGAYLDSLGWAFFKKRDYAQAEKLLVQAIEAMSDEAEIHEHMAELFAATGRPEDALRSWQMALDLGARNADAILARMRAVRKASTAHP